jgi:hypothetical protein
MQVYYVRIIRGPHSHIVPALFRYQQVVSSLALERSIRTAREVDQRGAMIAVK